MKQEHSAEKDTRCTVAAAIAAWEEDGPTSLTVALRWPMPCGGQA